MQIEVYIDDENAPYENEETEYVANTIRILISMGIYPQINNIIDESYYYDNELQIVGGHAIKKIWYSPIKITYYLYNHEEWNKLF